MYMNQFNTTCPFLTLFVIFYVTGYLTADGVLPETAPEEPENITDILKDVDQLIMPGVSSRFAIADVEPEQD